ncbi:MAG: hypothetical protein WBM00_08980 [Solirubrobacterales bacterium]
MPRRIRTVVALVVAVAMAVPATAQATLVFLRNPFNPVVYAARDNGSGAHRIAAGRNPRVSPDGQTIVFLNEGSGHSQDMMVAVAGRSPRKLMTAWRESFYVAFSPDSTTIAALRGGELGRRTLVLVDIASGAQRVIARGYFSGFSFSRDGSELVYSKAGSERFPPRSDIYRVPTAGGKPVRITDDHHSQDPLWGPTGTIVFVKTLGAGRRKYGPKTELFLMNAQGKKVRQLTHTKVDPLLLGLFPTDWSANGTRLLAEFEGQDTSYAVTVDPRTGAQRPLTKAREQGLVGTALSGDGQTILATTGGFEPGPGHDVISIPYAGGAKTVLARNAFEPDWSR